VGGVLNVHVVRGEDRLEFRVVEREQRASRCQRLGTRGRATTVLVTRGLLQLRETLEAERLREAHHGA
jgi:hypothetical protein